MNMLQNITPELLGLWAILLCVLWVVSFLGVIIGQLKRMNGNLEKITKGIQGYLNEVLREENEEITEEIPAKEKKKTHTKEEEEAFQAVLQEYFS